MSQPAAQPAAQVAIQSAVQRDVPQHGWVVQLGAFKEAGNADTMVKNLSESLAARSSINHDVNSQLYRVLVGPMASSDEANRLVDRLATKGIDSYTLKARFR